MDKSFISGRFIVCVYITHVLVMTCELGAKSFVEYFLTAPLALLLTMFLWMPLWVILVLFRGAVQKHLAAWCFITPFVITVLSLYLVILPPIDGPAVHVSFSDYITSGDAFWVLLATSVGCGIFYIWNKKWPLGGTPVRTPR
jgi:hypothetical protein